MTDHSQDPRGRLVGYLSDVVLADLPPSADALVQQMIQRIYLRRWLLLLTLAVISVFVLVYSLPLIPAFLGSISIIAGAAFTPSEAILRPLRLNLRVSDRPITHEAMAGALEGLPSPVIMLDAQRRVLYFNSLAADLWPALRQGDHISSYIRDPGVLEAVAGAHPAMRPRQMVPYEQRVPIERHMEARISWIGQSQRQSDTHAPAIMIHLRDLTERERIDRLRTDFVTNASHELRTPLAALIGFIETLQGAARDDANARAHFLDIMARQAQRMARLVDNLLSLSRIEMRMHLKPQTSVDLTDIAEQVLADLQPLAKQNNIAFHFEPVIDEAWVYGDRDELIQVVSNLVENSIKYGGEGCNVWLSIARETQGESSKLLLTVRDDGQGIDQTHLPRLTERFYRVNDAGPEKSGTGLGLAIVKHVITRHRGDLRIDSEPGKGAVFTIALGEAPPHTE